MSRQEQDISVFVINLSHRLDRRRFMRYQLTRLGIRFNFFDAVTPGSIPSDFREKVVGTTRRWLCSHYLSPEEQACYASHHTLWSYSMKNKRPIIVLEDDIRVSSRIKSYLSQSVFKGKEYVSLKDHPRVANIDDVFCLRKVSHGAMGHFISPHAASTLIRKSNLAEKVDTFMGNGCRHGLVPWGLNRPVVRIKPMEFGTDIQLSRRSGERDRLSKKIARILYRTHRSITNKIRIWHLKY